MWNHAAKMQEAQAKQKIAWQQLTTQDLSDMLVWLRNLPETRQKAAAFELPPAPGGRRSSSRKAASSAIPGNSRWRPGCTTRP